MKKLIIMTILLLCVFACMTASAQDIELYMFGDKIECDVPPIIENGRTLVPVRAISEDGLGANVSWDGTTQKVTVVKDDMVIVLAIGHTEVIVNSEVMTLDAPAKIIDGRTMVPVRFISETLDYDVSWDADNRRVIIADEASSDEIYTDNTDYVANNMNYITDINIEASTYDTLVNFVVSEPCTPDVFILTDPYRIVVDFENCIYASLENSIEVNTANINDVRWAKHDDYYRVVIDCNGEQKHKYVQTGDRTFSIIVYDPELTGGGYEPVVTPDTSYNEENYLPNLPINQDKLVVINPGHGGKDPGALGRDEYGNILYDEWGNEVLREKDVNLSVAKRVYEYLVGGGINVVMTHDTDKYLELRDIADFANNSNATLFVSIHSNSVDGAPSANGTEVLYYDTEQKSAYGITSKGLANNILKEIIKVADMTDRGLKERPGLAVMKWTNMPAALIELGFVTNAGDREKLLDDSWQDTVAAAIARGIAISLESIK